MTPLQSVEHLVEDLQREAPEFESRVRLVARAAVEPEVRATLRQRARFELSGALRRSARDLAGLAGTRLLALRARAGGSTAVVAIGSQVVPSAGPRAWPTRVTVRGLLVAAIVAVAAAGLAFAVGSLLRSRRSAAQPTPVTPQKEPFVIPIVTEPEPAIESPALEPVVASSQTPEADAAEAGSPERGAAGADRGADGAELGASSADRGADGAERGAASAEVSSPIKATETPSEQR